MPVIINDFEMVVEEPSEQPEASTPAPMPQQQMTPQDVERMMEHFKQRRARLHAD
jgi:hypothetical protein